MNKLFIELSDSEGTKVERFSEVINICDSKA